MINTVRNTVLSILNKNNYGYISPSDFNLFAKQAQLEIFENYFKDYNVIIYNENLRRSGTEYGNMLKKVSEDIDTFSETKLLPHNTLNSYFLPSMIYTNDEYFLINKVLCYPIVLSSGSNTSVGSFALIDSSATFITDNVKTGDIVSNISNNTTARVLAVASQTTLTLSNDIFTTTSIPYVVIDKSHVYEAERVSNSKITLLNNSLLTKPNDTYPAYTQEGGLLYLFPESLIYVGQVESQYIRYPKSPKWTYVTLLGGEPSFDQSQPDYQDFELPLEDEPKLIVKILQYAGLSIREIEVVQYGKSEENNSQQPQQ